jgi:hypothetical protein
MNQSILLLYNDGPVQGRGSKKDQPFVEAALQRARIPCLTAGLDAAILSPSATRQFLDDLPWNDIAVIDYRFCRGIPRHWKSHFEAFFTSLFERVAELASKGHPIALTPAPTALDWVLRKSNQLTHIQEAGLRTVPTEIFPNTNELFAHLAEVAVPPSTWVIKPDIGSGADRVIFLNRSTSGFDLRSYKVSITGEKTENHDQFNSADELSTFLTSYYSARDIPLLLQPRLDIKRELSAVYIGGIPHFIERLPAADHDIAHERFGGSNTYVLSPDERWRSLAQAVYTALPEASYKSASLRIDLFETGEGEFLFSEVEGASNRILIPETIENYRLDPDSPVLTMQSAPAETAAPLDRYIEALNALARSATS